MFVIGLSSCHAQMIGSMLYGFVFSYMLSFGTAFLISTFVMLPVNERSSGAKHCQYVSGVKASTYWLTLFVCDMISYVISSLCIIGVIRVFSVEAFIHGYNLWYLNIAQPMRSSE